MKRLERDIVLAKQVFVLSELVQQLSFRKPAPPPPWDLSGGHASGPRFGTIGTREFAVAFYFALLTLEAGKDPRRSGWKRLGSG